MYHDAPTIKEDMNI